MSRFFLAIAAILGLSLLAINPYSAEAKGSRWENYQAGSFAAAQKAGDTIVVDIYATWCPVCKVQAPILDELSEESRFANVRFVRVNFDEEKAFLRAHRIPRQSTVLVFEGSEEIARSIAETNRARLRAVVLKAL